MTAANLGYCEIFDFKCAADRTCDAWIVGGPITEESEAPDTEEEYANMDSGAMLLRLMHDE